MSALKAVNDAQRRPGDVLPVKQGDDEAFLVEVFAEDGSAADLTGYTAKAQIRRHYADYEPDVAVEIGVTIVLPNQISLSIPRNITRMLGGGYVWDLQIESGDGIVTTILAGPVGVRLEVTREAVA